MGSDPSLGARTRATAIVAVAIASAVIKAAAGRSLLPTGGKGSRGRPGPLRVLVIAAPFAGEVDPA